MSERDFDLRILKAGSSYLVDARSPEGEEANLTFELPVSAERLEELFRGLGHPRKATRGGASPEVREARDVGRQLFEAVFTHDIRDVFQRSLGGIEARGGDLRIRLHLARDVPELLDLPWELLFDRGRNRFLALERATTLVRHLPVQQRIAPMHTAPPLRILVAISNPAREGYPALDAEQEWTNLEQALRPLADRGLVSLTRLNGVTQDSLRQALKRDTCHVLHFIGHGGYEPKTETGFLVLEDGGGGVRHCSAARLTDLVGEQPALRLVVLNACEGGRSSRTDSFAGVAQSLVQGAIPAVVAMQFPVSDAAAVVLAGSFYSGLASGRPVDLALAEARREVNLRGEEGEIEWATPVLYMRGDGELFNISEISGPIARDKGGEPPSGRSVVPPERPPAPAPLPPAAFPEPSPAFSQSAPHAPQPARGSFSKKYFLLLVPLLLVAVVVSSLLKRTEPRRSQTTTEELQPVRSQTGAATKPTEVPPAAALVDEPDSDTSTVVTSPPVRVAPARRGARAAAVLQTTPKPQGTISLAYTGDTFGCFLQIEVGIGGRKVTPTSNIFVVPGVDLTDGKWEISGRISCPTTGWCDASGKGKLNLRDGATYHVVWRNVGYAKCAIELRE